MDTYLQDCFASGNLQLFIGSGLSTVHYPDSNELCDRLIDDPIYVEGLQATLRAVLGNPADVSLEDAADFYELYQGPDALLRVIKHIFGASNLPVLMGSDCSFYDLSFSLFFIYKHSP